jgi:transposase
MGGSRRGSEKTDMTDPVNIRRFKACVAGGMSNPTIAARFGIGHDTVLKLKEELGLVKPKLNATA